MLLSMKSVYYEPVADNEYLADFYRDTQRYAFPMQVLCSVVVCLLSLCAEFVWLSLCAEFVCWLILFSVDVENCEEVSRRAFPCQKR